MSRGKHIKNTGKSLWPGVGVLLLVAVLVLGVFLWRVTAKTPQADTGSEATPEPTARPVSTTPEPTPTPEGTVRIDVTEENFWDFFSVWYRQHASQRENEDRLDDEYLLLATAPEGYTWGKDSKVSFEISTTYTTCRGTPVEVDLTHGVLKLDASFYITFQEKKFREYNSVDEISYLWESALVIETDEDEVCHATRYDTRAIIASDVEGYITLVPTSEKMVGNTELTGHAETDAEVISEEITTDTIWRHFFMTIDRSYEHYADDGRDLLGGLQVRYSFVPDILEGYHVSDESTLQVKLRSPALRVEGYFAELDYKNEKYLCSRPVVYEETFVETEINVGAGDDWSSILAAEGYMRSTEGNRNYAEVLQIERVIVTEASGTLIYVKDEPEA